jgi:hypothetical protein
VPFPSRTDNETLQRLLESGKLTPVETADIQRSYDAVVAGAELDPAQRMKANTLYELHKLGAEPALAGRRRGRGWNNDLLAKFDAMPRPKRPPGK